MSTNMISNFSPLDEMIQLIYQNIHQFVVMSSVSYDKWTVHVGLVGDAGRWWHGVWEEKDVTNVLGPKPSEKLLETFVDKLVDSIVGGQLYLAGFNTEKGAKIKLTFGPTSTKPVSMDLEEIESAQAAAHATNVFLEIALQAQSRKCRLHPSTFAPTAVPSRTASVKTSSRVSGPEAGTGAESVGRDTEKTEGVTGGRSISSRTKARPKTPELAIPDVEVEDDGDGMKTSRKEKPEKRLHSSPEKMQLQSSVKPKAPVRLAKVGASLANPNKKARKIQAMEFDSDDE